MSMVLKTLLILPISKTCDFCRTLDEEDVIRKAFDLCFAFDEIISTAGYRFVNFDEKNNVLRFL